MSRYIDVADITKQIADFKKSVNSPNSDYMTGYICALSVTEGMIANTPTADLVEVVRCKDCKFNVANMEKDEMCINDYSGEDIVCSFFMTDGLEPKDYCSRGERRSENEG